jgi:pimeloyl-ACP methyl ester carboxylesterase
LSRCISSSKKLTHNRDSVGQLIGSQLIYGVAKSHLRSYPQRFFYLCLLLSICLAFPAHAEPDYAKTPIFFVHGHGMRASCWKALISYLRECGYPKKYLRAIQLYPNTGSNIDSAEKQIAPAIQEFLRHINKLIKRRFPDMPLKTKVDLISHSMGALSVRWYAAKIHPNRVQIWLSLGGANHGTDVLCAWSDPGARDLCPAYAKNPKESLVQYLLNGEPHVGDIDETPYGLGKDSPGVASILPDGTRSILYVSIRTYPDEWIKPEHSAILDGAGGIRIQFPESIKSRETSPGNILMTNVVGHDQMLSNRDTMRLVAIILGLFDKDK